MEEKDLRDGSLYEHVYHYKEKRSSRRFYCVLFVIVFLAFCFRIYWTNNFGGVLVDGRSMEHTLHTGDELFVK